ncbi:MAG: hypothetical protein ACSLFA_16630 [Mycobacterium sp.]
MVEFPSDPSRSAVEYRPRDAYLKLEFAKDIRSTAANDNAGRIGRHAPESFRTITAIPTVNSAHSHSVFGRTAPTMNTAA